MRVWSRVATGWLAGIILLAGCVVEESFLDGKPCAQDGSCASGYSCVKEACQDQPGYLCPVCRKEAPEDGGWDGADAGGDILDGSDAGADEPPTCDQIPPACKTLPDCVDIAPQCLEGVWVCDTGYEQEERTCDGFDNDCDTLIDEGLVCVLAGNGAPGMQDGTAGEARLNRPRALLPHPAGGLLVVDRGNHALRLLQPDGALSTLAGAGSFGDDDGPALEARFNDPTGAAVDRDGSILIADRLNHRIRKLGTDDMVTTFAGSGFADYFDGPLAEARFALPQSVAVASDGTVYVADTGNHCIRKIKDGEVTTFTGKCEFPGAQDGDADQARFNGPTDLLLLSDNFLVVAEESSHTLRQVSDDGSVITLAGTGTAGFKDDEPLRALFRKPAGCIWDSEAMVLLVADSGNNRIRSFAIGTAVTTRMGTGKAGLQDGPPLEADFNLPSSLGFLQDGRLVVADTQNHVLRVVQP